MAGVQAALERWHADRSAPGRGEDKPGRAYRPDPDSGEIDIPSRGINLDFLLTKV
jgi:hypothetical protein